MRRAKRKGSPYLKKHTQKDYVTVHTSVFVFDSFKTLLFGLRLCSLLLQTQLPRIFRRISVVTMNIANGINRSTTWFKRRFQNVSNTDGRFLFWNKFVRRIQNKCYGFVLLSGRFAVVGKDFVLFYGINFFRKRFPRNQRLRPGVVNNDRFRR